MPHVVIAAGVFRAGVQAVLGEVPETAQGTVVQAMTVSVTGGEIEPMAKPLGQGGLQAIVVGPAVVHRPVEIFQIGKFGPVRTVDIGFTVATSDFRGRTGVNLVDVDEISQPGAVIGHIANLEREVAPKGVLDIEVPIHDVGGFEIRVHRGDVAWSRVLDASDGETITARERAAGRKNHAAVAVTTDSGVPIEIGARDRGVAKHNGTAKRLAPYPRTSLSDRHELIAGTRGDDVEAPAPAEVLLP